MIVSNSSILTISNSQSYEAAYRKNDVSFKMMKFGEKNLA